MLDTPDAVFEALQENHDRPYGLQRTVTAEELVEAADQFEKPDALVTALLELMTAYEYTGEHRKAPVVFARLLQLLESTPGAFSEWEVHQVFWRFKWVTTSLLQVPDVPLATIHGWVDRMRERYRDAGHGLQPVAAMRYHLAAHTGIGTDAAYDLWVTRPREELSDCQACEIRHQAAYHLGKGDDQRALAVWQPVLGGELSCAEEPHVSRTRALLPLLRLGRTDEARSYHLSGYRFARGKNGLADDVGMHVEFCALSRNAGRGLEILAENRALFDVTGAPRSQLGFLTGVQVLLKQLVADGHSAAAVAGPLGQSWTAESLLARVGDEAQALAAAFDSRNGTTAVGDRYRARLAQSPYLAETLPLGLRSAAAVVPAAPAQAAAVPPDIPEEFAALLARARQMAADGHPGDTALWERIAERVAAEGYLHDPELGPEARLHAELAEQQAFAAYADDRGAAGRAAMTKAAGLFESAGMRWHSLAAKARALSLRSADVPGDGGGSGAADAGRVREWAELDEILREAQALLTGETGDGTPAADSADGPDLYLMVLQSRAFAAYQDLAVQLPEPSEERRERFESLTRTLRSEAVRLDLPHRAAPGLEYAADIAGRTGRIEDAAAQAHAALALFEEAGRPWRAMRTQVMLAQIHMQQHRPQDAAPLLQQALAGAARFSDRSFPVSRTHALLGHACFHTGDVSGAVRHLSEAAVRFDAAGDDEAAAEVRLELADVLTGSGQEADAVAVLESMLLDGAVVALDEKLVAQVRLDLARGLRSLEEHRASAEEFLRLADTVEAWEDQELHTLVASEAAVALARSGNWDAARAAYERAMASHGKAANPVPVLEMARDFAGLVMGRDGADGLETALGHLAEADGIRVAVPLDSDRLVHWYQAGRIRYARGRVLAEAERFSEALAEMEGAVAAYEEGGARGEAPRAEAVRVTALIEANGLGSPQAAITRLTAAAGRCEAAGLKDAAGVLLGLRDELASRPTKQS